jgi:hypothetical protein
MATAPLLAAPPALSTEPVLGWRVWRLHAGPDGPRLMSVTRPYVWPTAEPIRAKCDLHHGSTPTPDVRCTCGVYAAANPDDLSRVQVLSTDASVVGAIAMWGRVVEHTRGARSAFAYPARLRLVCATCLRRGRGGVAATVVRRVDSELVACCARHAPRDRSAVLDADVVQAALLDAYAVEAMPLERVARQLRRPGPRTLLTPGKIGLGLGRTAWGLVSVAVRGMAMVMAATWILVLILGMLGILPEPT